MRNVVRSVSVSFAFALLGGLACTTTEPAGPAGSAGTSGTAGTGSGAAGASAGTSGNQAGNGGGAGSAGGSSGSVAGSSGGTSAPMDGGAPDAITVGDAADGRDGSGGTSNADGGKPPKPSPGCGKANPATGARTITTGGQTGMFNVRLPANYVATTPMPLGAGFHGFGNGACGPTSGECQGFANLPAVTVYMKSFTQGWEQAAVLEQNITFFQDVVTLMKNEYCIDENRIFVAGVSSGGQFVSHLACRFGDWLWQVTPVSAGVVNPGNCKGTPPILVIHVVTDQAGNYGQGVAEMFAKRNRCAATPPAGLAKAKADMMTAFQAMRAEHVCMDWDGCAANPVRFCISSQITYSGLTHGWPKIGGMLIGDFIGMLP